MPPRQTTLHAYIDNDAPHQSALKGVYALARLRSPLADQVRERANKFVASVSLPGGTSTSPIIVDDVVSGESDKQAVPVELECAVCRTYLQTPMVSV